MYSLLKKNIGPVGTSIEESVAIPVQVSVDREYILFGAQRDGQMLSEIGMYIPHENKFIFSDHVSTDPENSMICFEGYKKDFFTSIWTSYLELLPIDFESFVVNPLIFDIFFFNETLFFYSYGALKFKSLSYFKDNFKILQRDFYWEDRAKVEEYFENMSKPAIQTSEEPINETSLNNQSLDANSIDRQSTIDSQVFRMPSGLNETDDDESPASIYNQLTKNETIESFSQDTENQFPQEGSPSLRVSTDSGVNARMSKDFLEHRLPLTQSNLLKGEFSVIEEESHHPNYSKDFSKFDNQSTFLKSFKRKTITTQTRKSNYFHQNIMNDDFFSKKNHFDEIDSNFNSNTNEEVSVFIQKHSGIQPVIDSPFLSSNQQQKANFSNQVSRSLQAPRAPSVNYQESKQIKAEIQANQVDSEDQETPSSGQYIISSGFNKYSISSQNRNGNEKQISEFETGAMAHPRGVPHHEVSSESFLRDWDTLSNKRAQVSPDYQMEINSDNIKEINIAQNVDISKSKKHGVNLDNFEFSIQESNDRDLLSKNESQQKANKLEDSSNKLDPKASRKRKFHEIQNLPSSIYGFKNDKLTISESLSVKYSANESKKAKSNAKCAKFEIDNNISYSQVKQIKKKKMKLNKSAKQSWGNKTLDMNNFQNLPVKTLQKGKFKTKSAQSFLVNSTLLRDISKSKNKKKNQTKRFSRTTLNKKIRNKSNASPSKTKKKNIFKRDKKTMSKSKLVNKSMQKFNRAPRKKKNRKNQLSLNPKSDSKISFKTSKKAIRENKSSSKTRLQSSTSKKLKTKSTRSNKKETTTKSKKKKIIPSTLETVMETPKPHQHRRIKTKKKGDTHFNKITKLYKNRRSKVVSKIKILQKSPNIKSTTPNKKNKMQHSIKLYKKSDTQQTQDKPLRKAKSKLTSKSLRKKNKKKISKK